MDWTLKLSGDSKGTKATVSQQGETRYSFDDLPPVTAMASLSEVCAEVARRIAAVAVPPPKNDETK